MFLCNLTAQRIVTTLFIYLFLASRHLAINYGHHFCSLIMLLADQDIDSVMMLFCLEKKLRWG